MENFHVSEESTLSARIWNAYVSSQAKGQHDDSKLFQFVNELKDERHNDKPLPLLGLYRHLAHYVFDVTQAGNLDQPSLALVNGQIVPTQTIDMYLQDRSEQFTSKTASECRAALAVLDAKMAEALTGNAQRFQIQIPRCGSCAPRKVWINNPKDWYRESGKVFRCELDAKANRFGVRRYDRGQGSESKILPKCSPYLVLILFFVLVLLGVSLSPPAKKAKPAQGGDGTSVSWTSPVEVV